MTKPALTTEAAAMLEKMNEMKALADKFGEFLDDSSLSENDALQTRLDEILRGVRKCRIVLRTQVSQ